MYNNDGELINTKNIQGDASKFSLSAIPNGNFALNYSASAVGNNKQSIINGTNGNIITTNTIEDDDDYQNSFVYTLKNGKIVTLIDKSYLEDDGNGNSHRVYDAYFEIRNSSGNKTKDLTLAFPRSNADLVTLGPDKFMIVDDGLPLRTAKIFNSAGNIVNILDIGQYNSIVGLSDGRFALLYDFNRLEIRNTVGGVEASLARKRCKCLFQAHRDG